MDNTENALTKNIVSGTVPMANIDGGEIRKLREAKGLTQLYLATFVGVTTDTVSRWENRRYPAIKMENAEKLAEALEVKLEAILKLEHGDGATTTLEPEDVESEGGASSEQSPPPTQPVDSATVVVAPLWRFFLSGFLVVIVFAALVWLTLRMTRPVPSDAPGLVVVAERILPDHVPAGQTFPVVIRIKTNQHSSVSLIVREIIPPGGRIVGSEPSPVSVDAKNGVLKWISRTDKQEATFAYLVQAPLKKIDGDQLRFSGGVTLNQRDQAQLDITGDVVVAIAPYHWADIDRNNKIDDEEILAVYDRYSVLRQMDFDRDLIDSIWTADGYLWDRKTGKYTVVK